MKPSMFPHMVASLLFGTLAAATAQSLDSLPVSKSDSTGDAEHRFAEESQPPGRFDVPAVEKTSADMPEAKPAYSAQDASLGRKTSQEKPVEAVVDLGVLREPSAYQQAANGKGKPYEAATDSLQKGLTAIAAVYRESGKAEANADCHALSLSVEKRVKLDPAKVLEVVESEVAANASCACEIVKTAIKASDANTKQVVAIVETAIHASPENMRIISQCAIASSPDSVADVQALLAKLDPNSGDSDVYSGKSAKSSKDAKSAKFVIAPEVPNPLDVPPIYIIPPPPVFPPPVTDTDPKPHCEPPPCEWESVQR